MKGLTFVETISITFEKMSQDGVTNKTAYFYVKYFLLIR